MEAKIYRTLLAASVVVIGGTSTCHAQSRPISKGEHALITDSYGRMLKDAASAQYRMQPIPLADNQTDGKTVYCFEVNAKNTYGGYTGYRAVIGRVARSKGKIVSFSADDDRGSLPGSTAEICRAFGYSF
jgi:hypothetical protein